MNRKRMFATLFLLAVALMSGCAMRTVDELYCLPKRSAEYQDLQQAIDEAMSGLEYSAPLSGENQQTVQLADLDGDGVGEYLLFAKGASDNPLQILIFSRDEDGVVLRELIESRGSAFDLVEYADIDGLPGLELVVGRQVSDQVLRSVSVYSFSQGQSAQLMTANYTKLVTCDLDNNGLTELMTITSGASEDDRASAVLYSYDNDQILRSLEVSLSQSADRIKRIMTGNLTGDLPAVYVASAVEENAIITDVFAVKNGKFANVSLSSEFGTSVQTLRNYYVYADDIDNDGILELPSLIMSPLAQNESTTHYLIRWYAMDINGNETDKMYTFHNFDGNWYLQLDAQWATRVRVIQEGNTFIFSLWDQKYEQTEKLFTVYILSGSDREKNAAESESFLLYRDTDMLYTAKLETAAEACGITQEMLTNSFHLIYRDWKTGETE